MRRKWHQCYQLLQVAKETVLSCSTTHTAVCWDSCCAGSQNFSYRASGGCFRRHLFGCGCWDNSHSAAGFTVMLNDFSATDKVYIACGCTDLRRGIDGLASIVQQQFRLDPFTNTLFLFCGRRRDRIKGLYWEGDGFLLLYKLLEGGSFQWPRSEAEARLLTPQQYRRLMDGLNVEQPKAHRPVHGLENIWGFLADSVHLVRFMV